MVNEITLEKVRPVILNGQQWNELKNCGISANQLYWAIAPGKAPIPKTLAESWADKIRRNPHNILVLLGPTGVGKTVLGIRYMVKWIAEGLSPAIYIPGYILDGLLEGELKIVLRYHEILGHITEFTSVYNPTPDGEDVQLKNLAHRYQLIMLDDVREAHAELINNLVEQVYQTGARLVMTSNLMAEDFKEFLTERTQSRLKALAYVLTLECEDLRTRGLR